jgi:hypothetical protein
MIIKKPICPICKCICADDDDKHRHLEEKHNNLNGEDTELMENLCGKEILYESESRNRVLEMPNM